MPPPSDDEGNLETEGGLEMVEEISWEITENQLAMTTSYFYTAVITNIEVRLISTLRQIVDNFATLIPGKCSEEETV